MSKKFEEMTEQEQEQWLSENIASTRFLRLHKEFKSGQANAKLMAGFLATENLAWTLENLEKTFEKHRDKFELQEIPQRQAPVVQETPPPAPPELPEWGLLTKQIIAAMPSETYKRYHSDRVNGEVFRRQVENVLAGRDQFAGGAR